MSYDSAPSLTADTLIALAEVGEALHLNLPLDALLNRLTHVFANLVACDALGIALTDVREQNITFLAYVDRQGNDLDEHIGQSIAISDLPMLQEVIASRTPLYIPDTNQSPVWNQKLFSPNTQAILVAPLVIDKQISGFLFVEFGTVAALTDSIRFMVEACARYAVTAIRSVQDRERLVQSELRYRLAASLTSDAVYERVLSEDNVNWSGDVDAFLNYPKGAFQRTETAWMAAIHPHDRRRVEEARALLVKSGTPFHEEYRMQQANGTYCFVLDRALRLQIAPSPRIVGVITDLTNTYELTDALVESEVRYRTLFTSALDAIFVTDSTGKLLNFNPAVEALTGREYAELSDSTLHDLVHPQSISDYQHVLKQLQSQNEISDCRRNVGHDAGWRHVPVRGAGCFRAAAGAGTGGPAYCRANRLERSHYGNHRRRRCH